MNLILNDVTLVVPAYGRPRLTERLLDSLNKANSRFPIIIVDDGTPVPLSEQIAKFPSLDISFHRNEMCSGPAASRNIGIWHAKTNLVAFTDNDVAVTADWMNKLRDHIENAPPIVAGVGGKVIDDDTCLVGQYATAMDLLNPYVFEGRVAYLVTANGIFRKKALMEIGGFDESFRVPGGEDPELSFRLLKAGYRLEYNTEAVVVHKYGRSWFGFYRMFTRYGRGCRRAMETLREQ